MLKSLYTRHIFQLNTSKSNFLHGTQILPWLWPPAGFAAGVDAAFAVVLVARVVLVAVVLVGLGAAGLLGFGA